MLNGLNGLQLQGGIAPPPMQGPQGPNGLAPAGPGQSPGPAEFSVEKTVNDNLQQARVQHKQLADAMKRVDVMRKTLDGLAKLGDQVTVEDVIKGAGTMVGAGFAPMQLAQTLSTMPSVGGQALQAWVAQKDQAIQGAETQLRQKFVASAIHKGISAMAALHVQTIKGHHQPQAQPAVGGDMSPPMGGGSQMASAPQAPMSEAPEEPQT